MLSVSSTIKKYKIDLWKIVYTDKAFYRYNEFHKFEPEIILSLIEQECRFFEKILDEAKPDFYLTYHTQTHHEHLLYELCRAKGIRVLMLSPAKVSEKFMISQDGLLLDDFIVGLLHTWKDTFLEINSLI